MNELYWITRFDTVCTISVVLMIIGIIWCTLLLLFYYIANGQLIYDKSRGYESRVEEYAGYVKTCLKSLRYSIPITIFSIILSIFVPTTKEALVIYGVGGTIDYVKSNPTAKQLPDKCIKALDKWVDGLAEEKKGKEEK